MVYKKLVVTYDGSVVNGATDVSFSRAIDYKGNCSFRLPNHYGAGYTTWKDREDTEFYVYIDNDDDETSISGIQDQISNKYGVNITMTNMTATTNQYQNKYFLITQGADIGSSYLIVSNTNDTSPVFVLQSQPAAVIGEYAIVVEHIGSQDKLVFSGVITSISAGHPLEIVGKGWLDKLSWIAVPEEDSKFILDKGVIQIAPTGAEEHFKCLDDEGVDPAIANDAYNGDFIIISDGTQSSSSTGTIVANAGDVDAGTTMTWTVDANDFTATQADDGTDWELEVNEVNNTTRVYYEAYLKMDTEAKNLLATLPINAIDISVKGAITTSQNWLFDSTNVIIKVFIARDSTYQSSGPRRQLFTTWSKFKNAPSAIDIDFDARLESLTTLSQWFAPVGDPAEHTGPYLIFQLGVPINFWDYPGTIHNIHLDIDYAAIDIEYTSDTFEKTDIQITDTIDADGETEIYVGEDVTGWGVVADDTWQVVRGADYIYGKIEDMIGFELIVNQDVPVDAAVGVDYFGINTYDMFLAVNRLFTYSYYDYLEDGDKILYTNKFSDATASGYTYGPDNDKPSKSYNIDIESQLYSACMVYFKNGMVGPKYPTSANTNYLQNKTKVLIRKDILTSTKADTVGQDWIDENNVKKYSFHLQWSYPPVNIPILGQEHTIIDEFGNTFSDMVCRRLSMAQDGALGVWEINAWFGQGSTPPEEGLGTDIRKIKDRITLNETQQLTASSVSSNRHSTLAGVTTSQHHVKTVKYTDAEAAAKIAADDLYVKVAGDDFNGNVNLLNGSFFTVKSAGDDKNVQLYHNDTHAFLTNSSGSTYIRSGAAASVYLGVGAGSELRVTSTSLLPTVDIQLAAGKAYKSSDGDNIIQDIAFSANWSNYDKEAISGNTLYDKVDSIDKNIEGLRGLITIKGAWDASTETYPAAPDTGDGWINDTQHTWGALQFEVWDWIVWNGYDWIHIHTLGQELSIKVNVGESIQDAVDLVLAAGGGTVLLMEGTHDLSGTAIVIDDSAGTRTLRIIGMGNLSIIDCGGDATAFDVDGEQIGHLTLKDFKIDATDITTADKYIIHIDENNNNPIIIDNVTIDGDIGFGWGIVIDSHNVEVKNCRITDLKRGIVCYTGDGSYANIHNNYIQDMSIVGILIDNLSDYVTIKDNHIEDCGIGIDCEGSNFLIEGNRVIDSGTIAISVDEDGRGTIVDNIIYDFISHGISINCDFVTCTSNVIDLGTSNSGSSFGGIYVSTTSDYVTVTANVCTNITNIGAGDGYGWYIATPDPHVVVVGNTGSGNDANYNSIYFKRVNSDSIIYYDEAASFWFEILNSANDVHFINQDGDAGNGADFFMLGDDSNPTDVWCAVLHESCAMVTSDLTDIKNIDFDREDWKDTFPPELIEVKKDIKGVDVGGTARLALKGVKGVAELIEAQALIIENLEKRLCVLEK